MAEAELKQEIKDKLALIADPHMGISIVDMGLVRDIAIDEENKNISNALTQILNNNSEKLSSLDKLSDEIKNSAIEG